MRRAASDLPPRVVRMLHPSAGLTPCLHLLERTLLKTLAVATWMQRALPRQGEAVPTPHLPIAYGTKAS